MEKKTKKILWSVLIILVGILIVGGIYFYSLFNPVEIVEQKGILLSGEELPTYLENHQIFQELPGETNIQINFGEEEYSVLEDSVESGELSDADVTVDVPEEYIEKVGELGLCSALENAVESNEVSVETTLSESELAWKYRDLLKYRKCIGRE